MIKSTKISEFFKIYILRHSKKLMSILFFEIIAAISAPFISYGIKKIIDHVTIYSHELTITKLLPDFKFLVGVIILSIIANRASGFVNMFTMPVIRVQIRQDVFRYLQKHSHKYFIDNFSGTLGHRITELSKQFSLIFSMSIFHFLPITISLITTVYLVTSVNYLFAITVVVWIIFYLAISFILANGLKQKSKIYASKFSMVSGRIIDSITNVFNIRAFANYDYEEKFLNEFLSEELKAQRKMFYFMELNRLFQGLANLLLLCGLILLSLNMLINKHITLGDFVLIYSLSYTIINNLEKVSLNMLDLFESVGSFRDSIEAINKPYEIFDIKDAKELSIKNASININNVNFNYDDRNSVFDNLDLSIKAKQKVGLVGVSGSGKTTLTNLLLRLYDLNSGNIIIDNQNIAEVTQDSLHKNITLIPQDPILFNRTLLENIKYGNLDASQEEVDRAAKKAKCFEFIANLPNGYDSVVGERGVKLSGGQRQRIAIARAFIKNSPILIMDEATSALDSLTEKEINLSLKSLMKDRTVIVIAHRLSTLNLMDRIIVFDEGKIIEDGTHEQLLKLEGKYSQMWKMQIGGWIADECRTDSK